MWQVCFSDPPPFPSPSAIVNTMNAISFVFITTKTITCVNTVRLRLQQYDLSFTRLRPKSLCLYMILFVKNYNVMDAPIIHIYNEAHGLATKYLVWFFLIRARYPLYPPSARGRYTSMPPPGVRARTSTPRTLRAWSDEVTCVFFF